MTELHRKIDAIMRDAPLDAEDEEDTSRSEEIEKLIPEYGWPSVQQCLLNLFEDSSRNADHWLVAAEVFWGALLDRRVIEANRVIASVYYRLPHDPASDENNLAWSITCELKGVGYLSDYDPLQNPTIKKELARFEKD